MSRLRIFNDTDPTTPLFVTEDQVEKNKQIADTADHIVTVSECSKRDIMNLLGVPGFDFETSQDVVARATNAPAGSVTQLPAAQLSNAVKAVSAAAAVVGEPVVASIYQLDGLVRRSTSLQLTADARMAREGVAA